MPNLKVSIMTKTLKITLIHLIVFQCAVAFLIPCAKIDTLESFKANTCKIRHMNNRSHIEITKAVLNDQIKLIKIKINLTREIEKVLQFCSHKNCHVERESNFYKPFQWQIITSHMGRNLLSLNPNYEILSLSTLKIGISFMDVHLQDEPKGCLSNVSHLDFIYLVRKFLLSYIEHIDNNQYFVCTSIMTNLDGYAEFRPICYNSQKNTTCYYLEVDYWSSCLEVFVYCVKCLAILFCPLLIPQKLYKSRFFEKPFFVKLPEKIAMTVKVSQDKNPPNRHKWKICLPLSYFKNWTHFQPGKLKMETEYCFSVKALYLNVEPKRLISRDYLPAQLGEFLYEKIVRCQIRHTRAFKRCCHSRLYSPKPVIKCCFNSGITYWIDCCRWFAIILVLSFIPLPWIFRLLIYYYYEEKNFLVQRSAAKAQGLVLTFKGHLLSYITPVHGLFLCVYIVYIMDLIFFGLLVKRIAQKFTLVAQQCFRDMHEAWTLDIISWAIDRLLLPFQHFGIVGFFVAPFYWVLAVPFLVLVVGFYYVPMINLFSRLLFHLFVYFLPEQAMERQFHWLYAVLFDHINSLSHQLKFDTIRSEKIIVIQDNSQSVSERLVQATVMILCLFTLIALIVLLSECVGYFIEMCAFTMIGIILNANAILPYVSLLFLITLYFFESIREVRLKFYDFKKTILSEILKVSYCDASKEQLMSNTAYFAEHNALKTPVKIKFSASLGLHCSARSLLLFINDTDTPHISLQFYHKVCRMPVANCPGSLTVNLLRAMQKFFYILIFLTFVLMVVMTFGGIYSISSTNQMLATLIGGFLPWILDHVIQMKAKLEEVDIETVSFKSNFTRELSSSIQNWRLQDLELDKDYTTSFALNETNSFESIPIQNLFENESIIDVDYKKINNGRQDNMHVYLSCNLDEIQDMDAGSVSFIPKDDDSNDV